MRVLLVSLLALAIPVASQQQQISDISPFLGTWTLNAAESKLGTLPHPVRLAVTFEVLGSDGMKVSTDQVYEDSRSSGHYEVRFDGYNHPAGAGGFPMSIPAEKTTDERRRAYLAAQELRPPIALFVTVLWVNDHTLVWTFHSEPRLNDTHESTTDPDARLFKNGKGKEAKLAYLGEVLMDNREGLIVNACVVPATGTGEREAATSLVAALPEGHATVGGDKLYDTRAFVNTIRDLGVTPHVAHSGDLSGPSRQPSSRHPRGSVRSSRYRPRTS
jgi:hypothetical protein